MLPPVPALGVTVYWLTLQATFALTTLAPLIVPEALLTEHVSPVGWVCTLTV